MFAVVLLLKLILHACFTCGTPAGSGGSGTQSGSGSSGTPGGSGGSGQTPEGGSPGLYKLLHGLMSM